MSAPVEAASAWRRSIFEHARRELANSFLQTAQPYLGLWFRSPEGAPAIAMEDAVLLPTLGAMSVRVQAAGMVLVYPAMLVLGEARLGVVAPAAEVLRRAGLREALASCYGGKPCSRIVHAAGGGLLFDWIFRDEWIAQADFMMDAIERPGRLALLADAFSKALQHLVISSCAILLGEAPE